MDLGPLILLLGICFPHWTAGIPVSNVTYNLVDRILENVSAPEARHVNLSNLSIMILGNNCFDTLEKVESLDLSYNHHLFHLPQGVFSKMKNLKNLSLSNNRLYSSYRTPLFNNRHNGFFNTTSLGLTNLDYLDISRTRISTLEAGQLFGVTKSGKVIVDGNKLRWITTRVFENPSVSVPTENEGEWQSRSPFFWHPQLSAPGNYGFFHLCIIKKDGILISVEKSGEYHSVDQCTSWQSLAMTTNEQYIDINLNSQGLSNLEDQVFVRINFTLDKLELEKNNFTSLAFVRKLPKTIRILKLDDNPISEIPLDSFYGMKNLESLSMNHTKVTHIEPGTFRDQENLESLILTNNQISELKPGFFEGLVRLKVINLDDNMITEIPSNMFTGWNYSPRISHISLDWNRISIIEDGAFSHMNVKHLSLQGNPLRDDGIRERSFNGSIISELDIIADELTRFNGEWFRGISGLEKIILGSTGVSRLEKGLAKYMKNVTSLNLEHSRVEILQNGALFGLSTINEVVVHIWDGIKVIEGGLFEDL